MASEERDEVKNLLPLPVFTKEVFWFSDSCVTTSQMSELLGMSGIFDILRFGISPGEYKSVKAALGGKLDFMIDESSKEYDKCFIKYLSGEEAIEEKLMENPGLFKTPIVSNGKQATIGYVPEIWSNWK